MGIPIVFIAIAIAALILLMLLIVFVAKYQTAKPDEALIISGSYLGSKNVHKDESDNKIKIVRGGGDNRLILFERWKTGKTNAPPPRTILILLSLSSLCTFLLPK